MLLQEKENLYTDYCLELNQFYPESKHMTSAEAIENFYEYCRDDRTKWINLFWEQKLVGFVVFLKFENEIHVAEVYVKPEYRKRGLVTDTILDYISRHDTLYSAVILEKNEYAKQFWTKLFTKAGYHKVELISEKEIPYGKLYGWRINKNRKNTHAEK